MRCSCDADLDDSPGERPILGKADYRFVSVLIVGERSDVEVSLQHPLNIVAVERLDIAVRHKKVVMGDWTSECGYIFSKVRFDEAAMQLKYLGVRLFGIERTLTSDDRKSNDGNEW